MADLTFRDFAGAIMGGDAARAAEVLAQLLGVDPAAATTATAHFQQQMSADPAFVSKAMGLRAAVTTGSEAEIAALLRDCFGLEDDAAKVAGETLRARYPRT
ncbi:MAG: hypothetical protein JWP97_2803 [Labilithrix sp.]|nr:hypothetical protein [Labilithrix sp.]